MTSILNLMSPDWMSASDRVEPIGSLLTALVAEPILKARAREIFHHTATSAAVSFRNAYGQVQGDLQTFRLLINSPGGYFVRRYLGRSYLATLLD